MGSRPGTRSICASASSPSIERTLGGGSLAVKWVPVTSANRFDQVTSGAIDLECGNTTVTLGRQERVDFSNMTFVDGGAVLVLAESKLGRLADLAGKTVGVKPGTTTETSLKAALKEKLIDARVVNVKDEAEALAALNDKRIDGYAADRVVLVGNVILARSDIKYTLLQDDFSFEPYALMMRRDPAFRLAVNRGAGAGLSIRRDQGDLRSLAGAARQARPAAGRDVLPQHHTGVSERWRRSFVGHWSWWP